ncbi:MAG: type II secretion system protein N [Limnobacter sp.]|nr:type II secretion system protein N [Limnobacter sp.]
MTKRSLGLWMLLVATACLVVFWPAYFFKGSLEALSSGRLQILHVEGSIWSGRASLGLSDGGQVYALPGQVTWSPVFFDDDIWLGVQISHPSLLNPLQAGRVVDGYLLTDGQARLPASWLTSLGAPFNTIKPEGILQVSWNELFMPDGELYVSVIWRDAQSALSSIRPLGEYKTVLTGEIGGAVDMDLSTQSGALMLEGKGRFEPGQRMNFQGYAWAKEESKAALTGLLSQMGRLEDGRYRLGVF